MNKVLLPTLIALVLPLGAALAEEGAQRDHRFHFGTEIGARWEDNIGLTGDDVSPEYVGDPEYDDLTMKFSATLSYDLFRTSGQEFVVSVTPFYNKVSDLSGLTNWGVTSGLLYRGEFGPGFTDPWYSFSADYTFSDFDESRIRKGDWFEAEAMIGKRFTPKFGISGGVRYLDRGQDNSRGLCPNRTNVDCPGGDPGWSESEVFEQDRWGAFIHADWFFSDRTSMFFEYSYWDGEEDATSPLLGCSAGQTGCVRNRQDTFADDPAFGTATFRRASDGRVRTRDYTVWRVEAEQHVYELGLRQVLTDKISVELVGAFMETSDVVSPDRTLLPTGTFETKGIDNYRNTVVMATVSFALR